MALTPSLAARLWREELMDGDDVSEEVFAACLRDLARVNALTRARPPTLAFVARALRDAPPESEISILDVGFGQGDMLRALARWGRRRGRRLRLTGIDLNPRSAPAARAVTDPDLGVRFETGDVFALPEDEIPDLVISSLVAHHMPEPELVRFLAFMEARARRGWFVNDLYRSAVAYQGFRLLAAVMRWHPFVRHDGPVSIARSFRPADWRRMITAAGLDARAVRLRRAPGFRLCVERLK